MIQKRIFISLFVTFILSTLISCDVFDNPFNPKRVSATVIIFGRHANANAFSTSYYDVVETIMMNSVYGGYVGVVNIDGKPSTLKLFDDFITEATNNNDLSIAKKEYTNEVLDFLKNEDNRAQNSEVDLLKAIYEAGNVLDVLVGKAESDKKKIKQKQIIIMNTGIVTTGEMNFLSSRYDAISIHRAPFGELIENSELDNYTAKIADSLYTKKLLPNLEGVNVVFIGLGDVALPQDELSNVVIYGIENLWKAIFKRCNVNVDKNFNIKRYISSKIANQYTGDDNGFPFVTPIKFEQSLRRPITIPIIFNFNSAEYSNPENAELELLNYADDLKKYLQRKPNVKTLFIVGSESREDTIKEYSTELSERRANAVKETIKKFGVPEEKMKAFGLAVSYPDRGNEWQNGVYNEVTAKMNRKVVLILDDIEDKEFLERVLFEKKRLYKK